MKISLLFAAAALATAQTPISNKIPQDANEGGDVFQVPGQVAPFLLSPAGAPCTARTADIAVDTKPGPSWISVSPATCTVPTGLKVIIDPAGLKPGTYSGAILSSIGSGPSFAQFKDEFDLTVHAVPPALTVAPSLLTFKGLAAGPAAAQPLVIFNHGGGGALDFTTQVTTDSPWLKVVPGSPKTDTVALATVDFPSLPPGVLRANVVVAGASGDPTSVDVNVLALPSGPVLAVSQTGFVFDMTAGAGTPFSEQVSIQNQGNAGMAWTAELLAGSKFLALTPSSGTTPAGGAASLRIAPQTETSRNASDLPPGDYYGLIRISSPTAANSPQYVLTVLHVSGSSLSPIVRPGGLILVSTGAVATKQVLIFGSSLDKYNFSVSSSSPDGLKWLSATPASGSIVSSPTPAAINVTASPLIAGLKPGLYFGEVNIATGSTVIPPGFPANAVFPAVNSPIAIVLVVLPAGAKLAERTATTGCTPASLGMAQTGRPGGFSARAGWPTPLIFTVLDDCANPVTNAQVVVTFSNGDPPLVAALTDPAMGQYSVTWVPGKVSSSVPTSFTAKGAAAGLAPTQVRYNGVVSSNPAPLLNRNGTLHQMYPQPGAPLAPGTLIQINGSGLATTDAAPADVPLLTALNGTSVLIGAYSVPLITLSEGALAAQMPVELAPNNQYPIIVSVNDTISMPDFITVAANTPGIQATAGYATAQHPDQSAITADAPAAPGEVVSIFLSGLGATDPAVPGGTQAPAIEPLARIKTPAIVTLGGNPMSVSYAGLAPGQVGMYRIDFTVPPDAAAGDLKLSVSQNGLNSNTALLTVGPGKS